MHRLTDFMATCAAIAGYKLPDEAGEDSFNILPIFTGSVTAGKPVREAVVYHSSFGVFSIVQGRWKLILDTKGSGGWPTPRGGPPSPGTPGQLYDIISDPAEKDDLWEREPDRVRELALLLHQCLS